MDRYRERERSPDRDRGPGVDSYIPSSSSRARPRSRSPPYRRRSRTPPRIQSDTWRRQRSPPRRADSRERFPDDRTRGRDRSPPPPKRTREFSPRRRSPLPVKRERLASPPRSYERTRSPSRRAYSPPRDGHRPRSRSPLRRDDRVDPYAVKSWRRRSPSPRSVHGGSNRDSAPNSRRQSPLPRRYDERPPLSASYRSPRPRSPGPRERSPPSRTRSPPPRESESHSRREDHDRAPEAYRSSRERDNIPTASDPRDRPIPTGPAARPPPGPSSSSGSTSVHSRPMSSTGYPAPSVPRGPSAFRGRGGPPPGRDFSRDYGTSPRGRGGFGAPSAPGRGGSVRDPYPPRDTYFENRTLRRDGPPFRGSSNSSSTTYPRTQRFNNHLADLAKVKEGGEKLPPLYDSAKADKLEEEAAKLRKVIDDKQIKKRKDVREWERLERESSSAALRSELAEEHLKQLNGEGEGAAAAF